ncbi:MAG: response regulator, partial [Deltaproteobacteria bacterium]|nr:response regulator [Deltaproteobacteria bacterium]
CSVLLSKLGQISAGSVLSTWLNWWIGDWIGFVAFCPMILVIWSAKAWRGWASKFERIDLERVLVVSIAAILPMIAFSADMPMARTVPSLYQFLFLLPVLWAALRLGPGTSFAVIAVIDICAALSATHRGFAIDLMAQGGPSVLDLQLLILSLSAAGGLVSLSVAGEREARRRSESAQESLEQRNLLLHHKMQELAQAENALAGERERLTVMLQSIGDGVLGADTHGNVSLINESARAMTGWTSDDALGKPLLEVLNLLDNKTGQPCLDSLKSIDDGEPLDLHNVKLTDLKGNEKTISANVAPMHSTHNLERAGVVVTFRDITDRHLSEERTRQMQRLEAVGFLAGGIAHDFNNLLTGIFGHINMALLEMHDGDHDSARSILAKSMTAMDRARDLTGQLLTFAKGGGPLKAVGRIAATVENSARFALAGSSIECPISVASDLPLCEFDENQIAQVFQNLVINAREAMNDKGRISIGLEAVEHGTAGSLRQFIRISVSDQGPGMPKEDLERAFDPFFTTKESGSGLGLAISYSIVNKHNGSIKIESTLGKGTTIHVLLPVTHKSLAATTTHKVAQVQHDGRVLVMDDDEGVSKVLASILKRIGMKVTLADDGEQAIAFVQSAKQEGAMFAIAFLDLTVPGAMGGKEAVRKIHQIAPSLPCIAISGYSEDGALLEPQKYGFASAMRKPFVPKDVKQVLALILG